MNAFPHVPWRDSRHVAVYCDGNMHWYKHLDPDKFHGVCAAKTSPEHTEAFESNRINGLVWELWLIERYTDVLYCANLNQCATDLVFLFHTNMVGLALTTVKLTCDVSLGTSVWQFHIVCRRNTLRAGGPWAESECCAALDQVPRVILHAMRGQDWPQRCGCKRRRFVILNAC